MKKYLLTALIIFPVLAVLPRHWERSSAADCYWAYDTLGDWSCLPYGNSHTPATYAAQTPGQQGKLYQTSALTPVGTDCIYETTVAWEAQQVQNAQVTVSEAGGPEKLFASGSSGQAQAPWIVPGKNYRFSLWDAGSGAKNKLAELWVSGSNLTCAVPNQIQHYPAQPYYGSNFYEPRSRPTLAPGNVAVSSNQAYCIGQVPIYTISGGSAFGPVQWTSYYNGVENSSLSFVLNESGNFSGSGNVWTSADVGQWKKTVVVGGANRTLEFDVRDCGSVTSAYQTNYPTTNYNPSSYQPSNSQPTSYQPTTYLPPTYSPTPYTNCHHQ